MAVRGVGLFLQWSSASACGSYRLVEDYRARNFMGFDCCLGTLLAQAVLVPSAMFIVLVAKLI